MRAQGRIERAELPYDARHPFILPRRHHLTDVTIEEMRRTIHHSSVEQTICELRQRYWIPRKWHSRPSVTFMAPLPTARLQACQPPFSCVGSTILSPYPFSLDVLT
uniref:Integrase zinc-binding domain-containing protein n=1 Tax=Trichuris muris TaxID=70415 RepID=A0A5S6QB28_TRIMR